MSFTTGGVPMRLVGRLDRVLLALGDLPEESLNVELTRAIRLVVTK